MKELFYQFNNAFELPLTNPVEIFAIILFIILISPLILGKLKIPGIIGLIVAGVIIGPFGIGLLEKNSAIELFSTIGLLYIMFIVGMELDIDGFKKNKHRSIVFGLLTFSVPMILGTIVCFYFLSYSLTASLLISSMFATHTLVAYPIVSKLAISRNEAVVITVGGTILTDTAVLILLAVLVSAEQGELNLDFWIKILVSLIVFSVIMFWLVPKIARWFFTKLESEKTSHFVFVLSVVFFAAFLAEIAGLEPIIGAFVAGLALNTLIPNSSPLMNRLEFVGNALFIPFFLISVGMLVDVSIIFNGYQALLLASILIVLAIASKWIAAYFTGWLFKYSKAQKLLIFGLSNARAAATLSVILVGYRVGIIDENILNSTVLLILVTCIISSFATEKASKKIVQQELNPTDDYYTTSEGQEEKLLLPVANFNNVDVLLDIAVFLKNKSSQNPITLLSVVSNDHQAEKNLIMVRRELEKSAKLAATNEISVNTLATLDHNIAGGIVRTAREVHANIIVLGWPRKTSLIDRFFGQKTDNIIENSDKNIFITHMMHPLNTHDRLLVYLPPFVEYEKGFILILNKAFGIANELSMKLNFYCLQKTAKKIKKYIEENSILSTVNFEIINAPGEFRVIRKHIQHTDIFIVVNARKNSVSYSSFLDTIPRKLDQDFSENSVILIYPQVEAITDDLKSIGTTL